MAPRLHLVGRGRLGTSKTPTRASVKRKRAVLDGGGQGWLSRRVPGQRRSVGGHTTDSPWKGFRATRVATLPSGGRFLLVPHTYDKQTRKEK